MPDRPEDPLGDLGGERQPGTSGERPSAAERLAELDSAPEAAGGRPEPRDPRRPGARYAWVVGVAALIAIVVVSLNSLPNTGRGIRGPAAGSRLPAFAAPAAASAVEADANICQEAPCAEGEGEQPACEVAEQDAINICDLRDAATVVTFVTPDCPNASVGVQLDRVEAVSRKFPRINFVGVIFGASAEESARLARAGDWTFPVAADRDAAVFSLYRVAECPSTVFAEPGGRVRETTLGALTEEELTDAVTALDRPEKPSPS